MTQVKVDARVILIFRGYKGLLERLPLQRQLNFIVQAKIRPWLMRSGKTYEYAPQIVSSSQKSD